MDCSSNWGRSLVICALLSALTWPFAPPAWAEPISVELPLTPPAEKNVLQLTLTATVGVVQRSDSDTTTITGNLVTNLQIEFDPLSAQVNDLTGLEFTGGLLAFSDVSFRLSYGFLGDIVVNGRGISGTVDTPAPPGSVSAGTFDTAEHLIILDHGTFEAYGTGALQSVVTPISINLADEPMAAASESTGQISASLLSRMEELDIYQARLVLPVDFEQTVMEDQQRSLTITVKVQGSSEAVGQFTRKSCPLVADLTGDCEVDAQDLLILCDQWLVAYDPPVCTLSADLAGDDCFVNLSDFAIMAAEWLQ